MDVRKPLLGLVITIIVVAIFYFYFYHGSGREISEDCGSVCESLNYEYGVCRDEMFGCASDELDLGKNNNECVNAHCCCVTGCDYVCKGMGHGSGYCNFGPECEEGETNIGPGICKSGWPTTALTLCCCK